MSGACPSDGETTAVGRPSDAGTAAPRPGPGPDGFQFQVEELHCLLVRIVREGREVARAQLHYHPPGAVDVADLFVAPEHRGRGLARAVLSYCLRLAEDLGVGAVTAHTSPLNLPAYNLFRSMGFHTCQAEEHLERPVGRHHAHE
jgi:GNAT superfamily N-acetyltransferase